jgi:hypothetical protein
MVYRLLSLILLLSESCGVYIAIYCTSDNWLPLVDKTIGWCYDAQTSAYNQTNTCISAHLQCHKAHRKCTKHRHERNNVKISLYDHRSFTVVVLRLLLRIDDSNACSTIAVSDSHTMLLCVWLLLLLPLMLLCSVLHVPVLLYIDISCLLCSDKLIMCCMRQF